MSVAAGSNTRLRPDFVHGSVLQSRTVTHAGYPPAQDKSRPIYQTAHCYELKPFDALSTRQIGGTEGPQATLELIPPHQTRMAQS